MTFWRELPTIGIIDSREYYFNTDKKVSDIEATLPWDRQLADEMQGAKNFLLAGCGAPRSILLFAEFIHTHFQNTSGEKCALYVMDMTSDALKNINKYFQRNASTSYIRSLVNLQIIGGDLRHIPMSNNGVDYIRLDCTQNFISLKDQRRVLRELRRTLSPNGLINNVLDCIDLDAIELIKKDYPTLKTPRIHNGVHIDKREFGNLLIPMEEKLKQIYADSRLDARWGTALAKEKINCIETRQIILSKITA